MSLPADEIVSIPAGDIQALLKEIDALKTRKPTKFVRVQLKD